MLDNKNKTLEENKEVEEGRLVDVKTVSFLGENDIFNSNPQKEHLAEQDIDYDINVGLSFERAADVVEKAIPEVVETVVKVAKVVKEVSDVVSDLEKEPEVVTLLETIKNKVNSINMGKLVTVIHGDMDNQKVLKGRIVSMIDNAITIIDRDPSVKDPVVVQYKKIIDIFEVKRFKKDKDAFSMFKLNKKVREFFTGTEEELEHAYKQKITVKKLRDELKKKDKDK